MAETKRASADQPITRHPLFPAIAALWLGALFGLGSLAIGPAVIERIVLATGIDKVIPMAAPPLGTTTRILLALVLTALGAVVGLVVARRIAGNRAADGAHGAAAPLDPAKSSGETSLDAAAETAAEAPRRRRGLTAKVDDTPAAYSDRVPVPGHDPQILNVAEFDLDGFEDDLDDAALPASAPFRPRIVTPALAEESDEDAHVALPAWLDAESAWREPQRPAAPVHFETSAPAGAQVFRSVLDEATQAQQAEVEAPQPAAGPHSLFETYSRELAPLADVHDADDAIPEDAEPVAEPVATFTAAPADETAEPGFRLLPRLPRGDWDAQVPAEATAETAFEPTAPFVDEIADLPEAAHPTETFHEDAASPWMSETAADEAVSEDVASEHLAPQAEAPFAAPPVAHDEPVEAATARDYHAIPHDSAARRIADADLDYLSPVELLERLALAMATRREAARVAALSAPAPFAAPAGGEQDFAPDARTDTYEDTGHVVSTATDFAPPPPAVPTALRPFAFDNGLDAEDGPLPGYAPPRHLGLAAVREQAPDAAFDPDAAIDSIPFPRSPFAHETQHETRGAAAAWQDANEDADAAEPALAHGYASLLNLSRNTGHARRVLSFDPIEDESDAAPASPDEPAALAPIPVLPEEASEVSPFTRPVLAPAPELRPELHEAEQHEDGHEDTGPSSLQRPFDAPGRADADQTERALRAALATLQRMSGAA